MALSRRLTAIASFISKDAVVADIGSDHGLLLRHLLDHGIISTGYGSDNKNGPFRRLQDVFRDEPRVGVYMASGLDMLPDDVDTVVIAGMGGALIAKILEEGRRQLEGIKRIVLGPHNQADIIRKTISTLGLAITKETVIEEDGQFYDIIALEKGKGAYDDTELAWGPHNIKHPNDAFLAKMKVRLAEIARIMAQNIPQERRNALQQEKDWIEHYDHHK